MRYRGILLLLVLLSITPFSGLGQDEPNISVHVVQRGENLYRISLRYGLTIDQLASANGITNPDSIAVGQRLIIPQPGSTEETETALSIIHIVQPGETLASVAAVYQTTAEALASANSIDDPATIFVGQRLTVPGAEPVKEPAPVAAGVPVAAEAPGADEPADGAATPTPEVVEVASAAVERDPTSTMVHIVQRGESLFAISKQYGVSVNDIVQANAFTDPSLIYPGQELVIPGVSPPQYAGALPAPVERLTIMPLVFVEGRSARVDFATTTAVTVTGRFLETDLHAFNQNGGTLHSILIGVPIGTSAGIYPLTLSVSDSAGAATSFDVNIQVNGGGYRQEWLTLGADQLDLINPNVDQAEIALLQQVMTLTTPERYFTSLMGLPAAAPLSSPFGNSRNYNNGTFENVHTGTDFAAPTGAPILAPAAGRVVLADTLNVRGVATVLDHGWGVYTGYWHQTERYVSLGDFVEEGQVIGSVGSTGRATGAHLHWELWVSGVPVDPMQWVSEPLGY
ncbi:MAG: LysM peptidoglycan-binding domain-containing protein [Chloroflexi bacterium]|nr:LysM peptidoglycan-binding domain-containing protein [Chloroflexota bacterium]